MQVKDVEAAVDAAPMTGEAAMAAGLVDGLVYSYAVPAAVHKLLALGSDVVLPLAPLYDSSCHRAARSGSAVPVGAEGTAEGAGGGGLHVLMEGEAESLAPVRRVVKRQVSAGWGKSKWRWRGGTENEVLEIVGLGGQAGKKDQMEKKAGMHEGRFVGVMVRVDDKAVRLFVEEKDEGEREWIVALEDIEEVQTHVYVCICTCVRVRVCVCVCVRVRV